MLWTSFFYFRQLTYQMTANWKFFFLLFFIVVECAPIKGLSQDAHDILDAYFAAVTRAGNNWEDIKTVYIEGQSSFDIKQFNEGVVTFNSQQPSFYKRYIEQGIQDAIIYYNDSSYKAPSDKFFFVKDKAIIILNGRDPLIKNREHQQLFEFHVIQIKKFIEDAVLLQYNGPRSVPNTTSNGKFEEVEIKTKDKRHLLLHFNTETHLLEYWTAMVDETLTTTTYYYDYKDRDGFLVPQSEATFRNGRVFNWNSQKTIILNAKIDPTLFDYKKN